MPVTLIAVPIAFASNFVLANPPQILEVARTNFAIIVDNPCLALKPQSLGNGAVLTNTTCPMSAEALRALSHCR